MRKYHIYRHTTPDGKVYIGCTCQNPEARWGKGGENYQSNKEFWCAIQKYGWDSIEHEILRVELDRQTALALEYEYIHQHKATNPDYGYNHISGPKYRMDLHEKFRKAISERSKGYWANPEYRALISRRVSEARKGIRFTNEHREYLRQSKLKINQIKGNQCWVYKDHQESLIPESELSSYLGDGWVSGRLNDKNIYMHKQGCMDIKVTEEEVEDYTKQGWVLGRGDEVCKSISKSRRNFVWKYRELEFESSTDLTEYLKQHGYPKIAMSTVTGLARGGKYTTYQELMGTISKIRK